MRPALRQIVMIHGHECLLLSHGRSYLVRDSGGKVLARAMSRLLAVARAAIEVQR